MARFSREGPGGGDARRLHHDGRLSQPNALELLELGFRFMPSRRGQRPLLFGLLSTNSQLLDLQLELLGELLLDLGFPFHSFCLDHNLLDLWGERRGLFA